VVFWNTTLRNVIPADLYTEVKASRKRYFIYGIVVYRDTLKGDSHETRFCFFYNPQFDRFDIAGPREMTKLT
jgi:hypothetical protein